jgi:hypothetical protein
VKKRIIFENYFTEISQMKRKFYVFMLLSIFFGAFQNGYGQTVSSSDAVRQESGDTRREFFRLWNNLGGLRANKSYRIKETTEVYDEKGATLKAKYIFIREDMPPESRYIIATSELSGVTKKREFIGIGDKSYSRKEGGKWEKYLPNGESIRYAIGDGPVKNVKILEETTFNNQPVKVYYVESSDSIYDKEPKLKTKYWFTSEGELLKTEEEINNFKANEIARRITLYEYDPNIKIEAPIK